MHLAKKMNVVFLPPDFPSDLRVIFRSAKITPTKNGQFVTFWKRSAEGPIAPYDVRDQFDLLVVNVNHALQAGQFVFPKQVLLDQGVLSSSTQAGKRALRVYPPWDIPESKQAEKTQKWQLIYFFESKPVLDTGK